MPCFVRFAILDCGPGQRIRNLRYLHCFLEFFLEFLVQAMNDMYQNAGDLNIMESL